MNVFLLIGKRSRKRLQFRQDNEMNAQIRPVNFECAHNDWNTDMLFPLYLHVQWLEQVSDKLIDHSIFPNEYLHSIGNLNGNFNQIWNVIYKNPNIHEGFHHIRFHLIKTCSVQSNPSVHPK